MLILSRALSSLAALLLAPASPFSIHYPDRVSQLDNHMRAYFANPADQAALQKSLKTANWIIYSNSPNSACSVYAFGVLQTLYGIPVFIDASNKNILSLKSSKEESISQLGSSNESKWDEIISMSQVEFQKGLAYRGEIIGKYMDNLKRGCKGGFAKYQF